MKSEQGSKGLLTATIGPINTLNGVRNSTQIARNLQSIDLFKKSLDNDIFIQDFAITFPPEKLTIKDEQGQTIELEFKAPLSWKLTQAEKENFQLAWEKDPTIRNTVNSINKFWNESLKKAS